MKTLVVGDVHGCAASLRALLHRTKPERILLLGDIFAKGPDPAGVWEVIADYDTFAVLGNHDARLLEVWGQEGVSAHHRCWRALPEQAREWTSSLPLTLTGDGWRAVHAGVHPTLGYAGTPRRQLLTMRRWPDDASPENPFWFTLYQGPERIYYGHDAMRGVQIHPHSVGLDSGCVYGGLLSGMILETGELVQVDGHT